MMQTNVTVSLPQMVDLALGSPEVGAVNFNILHNLLHVLIQQVQLRECSVEFSGPSGERIRNFMASAPPTPQLVLTECVVTNTGKKMLKKRKSTENEAEVATIDPRKDSKEEPKAAASGFKSPGGKGGSSTSISKKKTYSTVVIVEPSPDDPRLPGMSVTIPHKRFLQLEGDIYQLKEDLAGLLDLPKNTNLIDALRGASGADKSTPVVEMLQMLNLTKRVDAAEASVTKLASMIEDLAKESRAAGAGEPAAAVQIPPDLVQRFDAFEDRLAKVESAPPPAAPPAAPDSPKEPPKPDADDSAKKATMSCIDDLNTLREDVVGIQNKVKKLEDDITNITNKAFKGKDLDDIKKKLKKSEDAGKDVVESKIIEFDKRMVNCTEKIESLDAAYGVQFNMMQDHLTELENELGTLLERVNTCAPANDVGPDNSYGDLFSKISKLQEDLDEITKVSVNMTKEQEEKQLHMDALVEQVELLKLIKADREDLEDALADKADTQQINRKVSHDQFDAACDDLTRGLEQAMAKLSQQEQLWQNALDEIQASVSNKLDRGEFNPLKEFVSNKIKALQERLKALLALKQEQQAAGTKSKFLRNVNCISCDKDVVMQKVNPFSTMPMPDSMPGTRSMKPYLTYELDAVRKQQKCLPQGRDLNFLQKVLKDGSKKDKLQPSPDHLCNRYCGGSHTTTSPQQRVARMGHFLTQWGPEALPVREGQIQGKDGQMYKAREEAEVVPPKPAEPTITPTKQSLERPKSSLKAGASQASLGSAKQKDEKQSSVDRGSLEKKAPGTPKERSKTSVKRSSRASAQRLSSDSKKQAAPPTADEPVEKSVSRVSAKAASESQISKQKIETIPETNEEGAQAADQATEQAAEQPVEQPAEPAEQAEPEQAAEAPPEPAAEQPAEPVPEQPAEAPPEEPAEPPAEEAQAD